MPNTLGNKTLHILHAEDKKDIFKSCKESIVNSFYKEMLPEPLVQNERYCNGIFRRIMEMKKLGKVYDILLLDLELLDKSDYNGVKAIKSIREMSPHTNIIVLSGNIYDEEYSEKLQEYKDEEIIVDFFETSNHEKWCKKLIELVTVKNVGILQFSDMHISMQDNSKQIISDFIKYFDEKVDMLIFSGDITNRGKLQEFEKAKELLKELCITHNIKKNIYVPGNHDIQRNTPPRTAFFNFLAFKRMMEEYVSEEEILDMINYPNSMNYADYINTVSVFPSLRTIVCGLNSVACQEDEKFGYSYGEISSEQLRQFENKLKRIKEMYPNYLVICTFHHNMFEPPYYFDVHNSNNTIEWIPPVKKQGLILKKCFENKVNILLTGHSHVSSSYSIISHDYENKKPLHIISAGLFSEKGITPLEPYLTVNYITYQIDLSGNIKNMKYQPFKLNLSDGNWDKAGEYKLEL